MPDLSSVVSWVLVGGVLVGALYTLRAPRLLPAALWLAATSALTSLLLYTQGARQAAVIELSVGAGLVLILFIFTLNLAGDAAPPRRPAGLRPLALTLTALSLLLLAELAWPLAPGPGGVAAGPLAAGLWRDRPLDALVQIVLLFAGAVTLVGLLAEPAAPAAPPPPPGQEPP